MIIVRVQQEVFRNLNFGKMFYGIEHFISSFVVGLDKRETFICEDDMQAAAAAIKRYHLGT